MRAWRRNVTLFFHLYSKCHPWKVYLFPRSPYIAQCQQYGQVLPKSKMAFPLRYKISISVWSPFQFLVNCRCQAFILRICQACGHFGLHRWWGAMLSTAEVRWLNNYDRFYSARDQGEMKSRMMHSYKHCHQPYKIQEHPIILEVHLKWKIRPFTHVIFKIEI